jgi:AcrR family transcriptional regulator
MGAARNKGRLAPLYRRLPHGPSGLARETVAGNQRGRLLGAIVESVAERGYQATSVAHVIGLAGVSRRAFYEQFSNKEECCLCAHDVIAAHARKHVLEAWARERGWEQRLQAACKALLDAAANSPKGARLVLLDAPAIGSSGRERMRLADFSFERLLAGALRTEPRTAPLPLLAPSAIVAGVRHVLLARLSDGREQELRTLSDQLVAWIESYRPSEVVAERTERPRTHQRAAPPPAGSPIRAGRRAGEREQTAARVELMLADALVVAGTRLRAADAWPQGVSAALSAFLDSLRAHEALVRRAAIEHVAERRGGGGPLTAAIEQLLATIDQAGPPIQAGPEVARDALAGALSAILADALRAEHPGPEPGLLEHVSLIVLGPYLGADLALATVASPAGLSRTA